MQTVRALVLFPNSQSWAWSDVDIYAPIAPGAGDTSRLVPRFDPQLGLGTSTQSELHLTDLGGSPRNQPYQIFFRRYFRQDGSPINLAIKNLHPNIEYPWAGTVVVLKFDGSRRERYRHTEPHDISRIAEFFLTYPPVSQ